MTGPQAEAEHWPGWAGQDQAGSARGSLRVYLGFAPGAGATCALLTAGIDVIATVGLASLESLSDVVETITGGPAGATVPDGVVRAAEEVELVDVTPEVLRERMARGEIYPLPQAQLALDGPFQAGSLSALRELARGAFGIPHAALAVRLDQTPPEGHG